MMNQAMFDQLMDLALLVANNRSEADKAKLVQQMQIYEVSADVEGMISAAKNGVDHVAVIINRIDKTNFTYQSLFQRLKIELDAVCDAYINDYVFFKNKYSPYARSVKALLGETAALNYVSGEPALDVVKLEIFNVVVTELELLIAGSRSRLAEGIAKFKEAHIDKFTMLPVATIDKVLIQDFLTAQYQHQRQEKEAARDLLVDIFKVLTFNDDYLVTEEEFLATSIQHSRVFAQDRLNLLVDCAQEVLSTKVPIEIFAGALSETYQDVKQVELSDPISKAKEIVGERGAVAAGINVLFGTKYTYQPRLNYLEVFSRFANLCESLLAKDANDECKVVLSNARTFILALSEIEEPDLLNKVDFKLSLFSMLLHFLKNYIARQESKVCFDEISNYIKNDLLDDRYRRLPVLPKEYGYYCLSIGAFLKSNHQDNKEAASVFICNLKEDFCLSKVREVGSRTIVGWTAEIVNENRRSMRLY